MAHRIYKRGGPKDITKEAILKTKENSPTEENIEMMYLMGGLRNAIFNVNDLHPYISPACVLLALFMNQYKFCSPRFIRDNFRIGKNAVYPSINLLLDEGYVDEYSPRQIIEVMVPQYTQGMGKHYSGVEKITGSRYCLTSKGKELARDFEKQMSIALDNVKPIRCNPKKTQYQEKKFGTG